MNIWSLVMIIGFTLSSILIGLSYIILIHGDL